MQYPTYQCSNLNQGYVVSNPEGAHTNFFPFGAFGLGLGLGLLTTPWFAGRGPYCGGPYCGPYGPGGWGPYGYW